LVGWTLVHIDEVKFDQEEDGHFSQERGYPSKDGSESGVVLGISSMVLAHSLHFSLKGMN